MTIARRTRERIGFASRLAAVPGGYALTSLVTAAIARVLPTTRVEAAVTGMLLFFLLYAVLVLWAFSTRTPGRMWLWLMALGVLSGTTLLTVPMPGGA